MVVDLSGGMFSFGPLYVALSRCTSMSGLVLKRLCCRRFEDRQRVVRSAAGGRRRTIPPVLRIGI